MIHFGIEVAEGTSVGNLTVASGTSYPAFPSAGELFFRTDSGTLFVYSDSWNPLISSGEVVSVAGKTGAVSLDKSDVGLGNVDNTSDASKPVSTLQAAAISAATYTHPANHAPSIITQDASNRFVTDVEKAAWNAKGDVTLTGVQTLTNKTLTGYTETVYNLVGTGISVSNGSVQTKTLSANTTFTETLSDGQSVILGITAGSYSVTWPSITWAKVGGSGTAPTLTSTGVNWIILWKVGGVLRGSFMGTA